MKTLALALLTLLAAPAVLDDVERLDAWPALEKDQKTLVKTDVARLRKARTPEMEDEARSGLIAVGAGAAPALLAALGKEKDEAARARLTDVLDHVTGAAHTRLLAAEFGAKSTPLRRYALRRAALFPDPGTLTAAEAALTRAREPGRGKEPDPGDVLAAALAATAAGSLAGLDELRASARDDWAAEGAALRAAAAGVKGKAATDRLLPGLEGTRAERIAALGLLGVAGTNAALASIAPFLDDDDTGLRIGAINALRGIVDGDPPLPRLSAFDAIEVAQKWKARVR